jgi:hypothetical protein
VPPEQAAEDACIAELGPVPGELTRDEDLPVASGGVASEQPAQ